MNRIEQLWTNLRKSGKKAFSPFIMSAYPNYPLSLRILKMLADSAVDFIEVGMPFSDPVADGPVIQKAGNIALQQGAKTAHTLQMIDDFRSYNQAIPIIWMGYYNPVYRYGIDRFFADAKASGCDGVLLADLPPEEAGDVIAEANKQDICLIHLVSSVTPVERFPVILKQARGFIYYVAVTGITGTKEAEKHLVYDKVQLLKQHTSLPIVAGFGINNPQKARQMASFCDGVVVGSAFITEMTKYLDEKGHLLMEESVFLDHLKIFITDFLSR